METIYTGIDVSKLTLDVSPGGDAHQLYPNHAEGLAHLLAQLPPGAHCVLEASGPYYLPLACLLHRQGVAVSVVNPLVIKRFSQMRLLRAKTDKADARMIAAYGQSQHPPLWSPPPLYLSGAPAAADPAGGLPQAAHSPSQPARGLRPLRCA